MMNSGPSLILEDVDEEIGEEGRGPDGSSLSLKLGSLILFPKEEWLHKQGHFVKNWQKRYFSLSLLDKKLFYYADDSKKNCKGEYLIDACSTVMVKEDDPQHPFLLILHAKSKGADETLLMSAPDKHSRDLWVIAFEEVLLHFMIALDYDNIAYILLCINIPDYHRRGNYAHSRYILSAISHIPYFGHRALRSCAFSR